MSTITAIILGFAGSAGFWGLVQFLILRWDDKKGLKKQLKRLEKDGCRTQLLLLMSVYPDEKQEILKLAEYYFGTLKGNFYLDSLFDDWLKNHGLARPHWFNPVNEFNLEE